MKNTLKLLLIELTTLAVVMSVATVLGAAFARRDWSIGLGVGIVIGICFVAYRIFVFYWAGLLIYIGNHSLAQAHLEYVLSLLPNVAGIYQLKATSHFRQGDYQGAAETYSQAITHFETHFTLHPKLYEFYSYRCSSYYMMRRYALALVDADMLVKMNSEKIVGVRTRSAIQLLLGNFDAAQADIDIAFTLNPTPIDEANLYHAQGILKHIDGNYEAALSNYKQALKIPLSPIEKQQLYPSIYGNIGILYFLQDDYQTALAYFNKARETDETALFAIVGTAIVHYALGNTELARNLWDKQSRKEPWLLNSLWVKETYFNWTPSMADIAAKIIAEVRQ